MDRFYMYCSDDNGIGFRPNKGTRVKNNFGLTLYVYHSKETYEEGGRWWYVVEERTGLSFGRGHTRTEAIKNALTAIETRGIDTVKAEIEEAIEKHGLPPHLMPTYL